MQTTSQFLWPAHHHNSGQVQVRGLQAPAGLCPPGFSGQAHAAHLQGLDVRVANGPWLAKTPDVHWGASFACCNSVNVPAAVSPVAAVSPTASLRTLSPASTAAGNSPACRNRPLVQRPGCFVNSDGCTASGAAIPERAQSSPLGPCHGPVPGLCHGSQHVPSPCSVPARRDFSSSGYSHGPVPGPWGRHLAAGATAQIAQVEREQRSAACGSDAFGKLDRGNSAVSFAAAPLDSSTLGKRLENDRAAMYMTAACFFAWGKLLASSKSRARRSGQLAKKLLYQVDRCFLSNCVQAWCRAAGELHRRHELEARLQAAAFAQQRLRRGAKQCAMRFVERLKLADIGRCLAAWHRACQKDIASRVHSTTGPPNSMAAEKLQTRWSFVKH